MGNAHALVINKTHKKICIITFNQADLLYTTYTNLYVIMPGESIQVEAATDPIGLKIGIVYDAAPEGKILMYQMWKVKNGSVLTITYVNGGDISTFGDDTTSMGKQTCREKDETSFEVAIEALTIFSKRFLGIDFRHYKRRK